MQWIKVRATVLKFKICMYLFYNVFFIYFSLLIEFYKYNFSYFFILWNIWKISIMQREKPFFLLKNIFFILIKTFFLNFFFLSELLEMGKFCVSWIMLKASIQWKMNILNLMIENFPAIYPFLKLSTSGIFLEFGKSFFPFERIARLFI